MHWTVYCSNDRIKTVICLTPNTQFNYGIKKSIIKCKSKKQLNKCKICNVFQVSLAVCQREITLLGKDLLPRYQK